MKQGNFHQADFYEISYFGVLQGVVEPIQLWLKLDKLNGHTGSIF
jgi:hypothetical protein